MMNRLFVRASLIGSLGLMVGCSSLFGPDGYFRNRGHDYLRADVVEPMKVPEAIETTHIEQLYVIPPVAEDEMVYSSTFEVPRPLPMADNVLDEKIKIQSLSERRWILVNAQPTEVWPQVRSFLASNNLNVIYTNASEGVMETSWLKFQDNTSTKDKYRIKIDAGIQPQTTEVHVLHMSMPWETPGHGQVNWPVRSVDAEREAWMLDELAATLANNVQSGQAASLLAQTIGVSDRVKLGADNGEPILQLMLDYPRAWATVGHALDSRAFERWEEDDAVGVFYVDYEKPNDEEEVVEEETKGFFGRLFDFGGADEEGENAESKRSGSASPYALSEVLAHLQLEDTPENRKIFSSVASGTSEPLKNVPGYLVVVRGWDNEVQVRVRDAYARPLDSRKAKEILKLIRLNLI